jgi:hypothetical protein
MCRRWSLSRLTWKNNGCSRQSGIKCRLERQLSASVLHRYLCCDQSFVLHLSGPYIANSPQGCTRNGDLPGPNGDQFLRGHLHQHCAQEHGQFCIGCQKNTGGICTKESRRRSKADQRSARILVAQTPSSKSCRPHRRDGNGQYGSRRGRSCLSHSVWTT